MIIEKIKLFKGMIKFKLISIVYNLRIKCNSLVKIYPDFNITVDKKSRLEIGKGFCSRSNISIRVEQNGKLKIHDFVFVNAGCSINCMDEISIGNNVKLGQNVMIFDHDHDYKNDINKYVTKKIIIEDNVWIGANCVILKGSKIGKNCVIAAGTTIKEEISDNSFVYQQKNNIVKRAKE